MFSFEDDGDFSKYADDDDMGDNSGNEDESDKDDESGNEDVSGEDMSDDETGDEEEGEEQEEEEQSIMGIKYLLEICSTFLLVLEDVICLEFIFILQEPIFVFNHM